MSATRLPLVDIPPDVGWSRPATSDSRVLLPQPEAPIRQTNSPGATDRDTRSRATKVDGPRPNVLETSVIRTAASCPVICTTASCAVFSGPGFCGPVLGCPAFWSTVLSCTAVPSSALLRGARRADAPGGVSPGGCPRGRQRDLG